MWADLLRSSRPFSWINTGLPFLALALWVHRGPTWVVALGFLYFLGPYNLLLYGVNDLYDYESDRRNPRKGGSIEGGLIPTSRARSLWWAVAVTNLPILVVLSLLGGPSVTLALAPTAGIAVAYSIPPLRTKEIPGLDSLTSSLHFVLPCICGGIVAGARLTDLPWRVLIAFLLWGMASQVLGAIQDVRWDREAGIGSIATALGERRAALLSLGLYGAAGALVASQGGLAILAAIALLPYTLLAASCLGDNPAIQARRAWRGFLGMNLVAGFVLTQILLHAWGVGRIDGISLLAWGAAAGVVACLGQIVLNERAMRRRAPHLFSEPSVTIIVPARNEEGRIGPCLHAVRSQRYLGPVQVIVVDDGSTDGTAREAAPQLGPGSMLLQSGPKPPHWTGKCWAAHTGAKYATGDLLVLLDADTRLEPQALRALAAEVQTQGGGLVSILSRYTMDSLPERMLVPAFAFMQLCFLPIAALNATRGVIPSLAFAYGPCMAVRRADYEACGGHAAIASSDREDIDFGRLLAKGGHPVRFLRGADLASTRHYRTAAEIAGCWKRTYYAYGGHSLAVALLGVLGVCAVFLLPLVTLAIAFATGNRSALLGSGIGLAGLLAMRLLVAGREGQPASTILWHPVTWLATLNFQALGMARGLRGRSPQWHGRALTGEAA